MGKTSTKLAVYALVQLLLFHLSGLAAAVDYRFYERADACLDDSMTFINVPAYYCCRVDWESGAGAVETASKDNELTQYYEGGDCCVKRLNSRGNICVYGGGFTGAAWRPLYRQPRQSLVADEPERACNAQTKPTGIAFSEESTKGHWILTTDNATEMYTQMRTIPYAQKVDWLQAHGATFEPDL